jgi:proteasome lid subunit RPN8/RPN11
MNNLTNNKPSQRRIRQDLSLVFSPLAWLKLQLLLHAGETEVAGFGVSGAEDLLYIEEFVTVAQSASAASVELDDAAVADYFDRCVDRGLPPQRCGRCWIHTHPGDSAQPSLTDERTFERAFGDCDWSIMCIISRTGRSYARLAFSAGPGAAVLLPVKVDWASWPQVLVERGAELGELAEGWIKKYLANIKPALGTIAIGASRQEALLDELWMETYGLEDLNELAPMQGMEVRK